MELEDDKAPCDLAVAPWHEDNERALPALCPVSSISCWTVSKPLNLCQDLRQLNRAFNLMAWLSFK